MNKLIQDESFIWIINSFKSSINLEGSKSHNTLRFIRSLRRRSKAIKYFCSWMNLTADKIVKGLGLIVSKLPLGNCKITELPVTVIIFEPDSILRQYCSLLS